MLLETLETKPQKAPARPHKTLAGTPLDYAWPLDTQQRYDGAFPSKDISLTGQKFQWVVRSHRLTTEGPYSDIPLLSLIPLFVRKEALTKKEPQEVLNQYQEVDPNSKSTHEDRVAAVLRFWENPFPLTQFGWVKEGNEDGKFYHYIKSQLPLEIFEETVISQAFIKCLSDMLPFPTQYSDYNLVEQVYRCLEGGEESLYSNQLPWSNEGLWFKHLQASVFLSLGCEDIARLPYKKVCYDLGGNDEHLLGPVLTLPTTEANKYLKTYNWPAVYLDIRPLIDYLLPYIGLALCQTRLAGMSQWSYLKKRSYQKHEAAFRARISHTPGQLTLASDTFDKGGGITLSSDKGGGLEMLPEKRKGK